MAFDIEATRTFRGVVDAEEEDLVIKFKTSSASVFKTDESCNPEKITFDTSEGTERDTSNFRIGVGGAGEDVEDGEISEAELSLIAVGVVDLDIAKVRDILPVVLGVEVGVKLTELLGELLGVTVPIDHIDGSGFLE
jgi:hypothetical protein